MSEHYISYVNRAIPVDVMGSRLIEAFDWMIQYGKFDRGQRVRMRALKAVWDQPAVISKWQNIPIPFDLDRMPFLDEDQRLLFKITFGGQ